MPFPRAQELFWIGALILAVGAGCSHAAGLGPIEVQSALGQQLRASVSIIGTDTKDQGSNCVKARVESLDGVTSIVPKIGLVRSDQTASIRLTTREYINEPALNILVELGCEVSMHRTYQILLDPVSALPTVQKTPQPGPSVTATPRLQAVQAPSARIPSASDANPPARTRKSREKSLDAGIDRALPVPQEARAKPAAKVKTAPRSMLRMSPIDDANITLRLKFSDTLTMPAGATPSPQPVDTAAVQDPVAMAARTEDLVNTSQMLMMKAEADALRIENNRIKQQGSTDKAALESVRDELFAWLKGLGLILILCLIAITWLAWRFNAIRKKQSQASWNGFFSESGRASSLEENALFNTTAFNTTELVTAATHDTEPSHPMTATDLLRSAEAAELAHDAYPAKRTKPRAAPFDDEVKEGQRNVPPIKYAHTGLNPFTFSNRTETARAGDDGFLKGEASLKAEEISDVMELVEAWMALHEPAKVLELLEPFNQVDQPESPLPWLCLLDVYSTLNDQKKYEDILRRITTRFNVKLAPWDARSVIEQPRTLADFPHVVEKIFALWDSDDIGQYLESLLIDNRDGARDGFDLPAYRDIARLTTLARDPARPRRLDQFKHVPAYAILFAEPTPAPEPKEDAAPTQRTEEDKPAETLAK